jgi:hypothetical protein
MMYKNLTISLSYPRTHFAQFFYSFFAYVVSRKLKVIPCMLECSVVQGSPEMGSLFILNKLWPITNFERRWKLGNLCDALRVHEMEYLNHVAF